ncbi:MAG: LapA family protein [Deltaproteobacteria bacterium]|nr:LapA family protein [Deltaproteobacteria bacterium]
MRIVYTTIFGGLLVLAVTFSQENSAMVTLKYFSFFEQTAPLYLVLIITFLVGALLAGIIGIVNRFRMSMTIKKMDKTIKDLKKQIADNEPPPIITASVEETPQKDSNP